jgi:hypothetical protein
MRAIHRQRRDAFREKAFAEQIQVANLFDSDTDLQEMRISFKPIFFEQYKKGFNAYIKGDWQLAKQELEQVEKCKGWEDHPTRNLLRIMGDSNYQAPSDWEGYRNLTEK